MVDERRSASGRQTRRRGHYCHASFHQNCRAEGRFSLTEFHVAALPRPNHPASGGGGWFSLAAFPLPLGASRCGQAGWIGAAPLRAQLVSDTSEIKVAPECPVRAIQYDWRLNRGLPRRHTAYNQLLAQLVADLRELICLKRFCQVPVEAHRLHRADSPGLRRHHYSPFASGTACEAPTTNFEACAVLLNRKYRKPMTTPAPSSCARLPTFSAVIDGLASGLGIARNKEDALASRGSFSDRIDAYSGSLHRPGLEDRLLDVLAGSDKALRSLVISRLLDAEETLTNARSIPLVTEATETEGLRRFVEIWAAPWIAQMLDDARHHPGSMLHSARLLLEMHAAPLNRDTTSYLATWKAAVVREIPTGIKASEFRSTLAKLDHRSQRKYSSIEQDLANLRVEMQSGRSPTQELDAAIAAIGRLYRAGMATMRLCAMAAEVIPENDLLTLITDKLFVRVDGAIDFADEAQTNSRIHTYWDCLDPARKLTTEYERLSVQMSSPDEGTLGNLRAELCAADHLSLFIPAIDFNQGYWHLCCGRNDLAEQCLMRVVASASGRQLGKIASDAASLLISLRLMGPKTPKFQALNPLMRIRIDNMPQSTEMAIPYIPTPFSDWSCRPKPSFYDSHLMACIADFNDLPRELDVFPICNPLQRFDAELENMIAQSRRLATSLAGVMRERPAIIGTSIKPYEMLRDHLYYRDALSLLRMSILPSLDAYANLARDDQLRLLRFVDPEQFQLDFAEYDSGPRRYPDGLR